MVISEHDDDAGPPASKVSWDINITSVLAIMGMLASGITYVVTSRTGQEQTRVDVALLRQDVKDALIEFRAASAGLPDLRANVGLLVQRQGDNDKWRGAMENRSNDTRDMLIDLRAGVTALQSASGSYLAKPHAPPR